MKRIIGAATSLLERARAVKAQWLLGPSIWVLLAWLGGGNLARGQAIPFADYFAPSLWSLDGENSFNPGLFTFLDYTGPDQAQTLQITSSPNPDPSVTTVRMTYLGSSPGYFSFDWSLTANGNSGSPDAYCYVGSTAYRLSAGVPMTVPLPVGAELAFELDGNVERGKAPAVIRITPQAVVPDSLGGVGLLPCVLLLVWHGVIRRRGHPLKT